MIENVSNESQLSILPSQISFNRLAISGTPIVIARREIFDIRTQLMAEDSADHDNAELIAGLEEGDLKPNFYEGGFKTWECSLDLAKLVASQDAIVDSLGDSQADVHIIEVGVVCETSKDELLTMEWVTAWCWHCYTVNSPFRSCTEPDRDTRGCTPTAKSTLHLCRLQRCRPAPRYTSESPLDMAE